MIFFKKKSISYKGYSIPIDESYRISRTNRLLTLLLMILSGVLLSTAFPPLNWEIAAFFALIPLTVECIKNPVSCRLFGYGYFWSLAWSFCAFFWLREINPFIPIGISAIIGLWGGIYACLVSFIYRNVFISEKRALQDFKVREICDFPWYKALLFSAVSGGLFILLEYIRINMFPWNFIGATQYKMLYLIQIVKFTGIWGVSFLIVSVNAALGLCVWYSLEKMRSKTVYFKGVLTNAAIFAVLILMLCVYGYFSVKNAEKIPENGIKVKLGTVQGNISQRRISTSEMAQEALDTYLDLSHKLAAEKPDIIIWPETAVPYPYFGGHKVCAMYRSKVHKLAAENKLPILLGTLDFKIIDRKNYEMTNSAFLIGKEGYLLDKYAKINRVPYGEFVPLRDILPPKIADAFGMGRDLKAGNDPSPMEILPNVRAGMAICYESIFASLARSEVNLGANILLAINNDAWYPVSSEPEQHAANALFRCIENNIHGFRSGNNGASVLILPSGRIGWSLSGHLLNRERKTGICEVILPQKVEKTFYTKFGDIFLLIIFAGVSAALIYGIYQYFSLLAKLRKENQEE